MVKMLSPIGSWSRDSNFFLLESPLHLLEELEVLFTSCYLTSRDAGNVGCARVLPIKVDTIESIVGDKCSDVVGECDTVRIAHTGTENVEGGSLGGESPAAKTYDTLNPGQFLQLVELLLELGYIRLEVGCNVWKCKMHMRVFTGVDVCNVHVYTISVLVPRLEVSNFTKGCWRVIVVCYFHTAGSDTAILARLRSTWSTCVRRSLHVILVTESMYMNLEQSSPQRKSRLLGRIAPTRYSRH
jgi:hypothetical protein